MATFAGLTVVAGTVITAAWGNGARDQATHFFSSATSRSSTITAPFEGMGLTILTDADQVDMYTGSKYIPVGPVLVDSLTITATAPFVSGLGAGSATTELSSKLRITAARVYAGHHYRFTGAWLVQQSASGSDWTILIREDSASGTIVGSFIVANSGTNAWPTTWCVPWSCTVDASSKVFFMTYTRNVGTATLSIYNTFNGGQCLAANMSRVGDSTLYRSVP